MRKLGGIFVIAALALAACSAPAEQPSIQPFAAPAPSATSTITAAPIAPKTDTETAAPATGEFGDPAADAEYLARVTGGWRGPVPSDEDLLGAAKFACAELASGKQWNEIRPVQGTTDDEVENSLTVTAYAGRVYCTDYSPFAD